MKVATVMTIMNLDNKIFDSENQREYIKRRHNTNALL